MTELWLIRHGQTDWNIAGRYQGQTDIPLNTTGQSQAQALAEKLKGQFFNAAYSSDLTRARLTAEILVAQVGCPLTIDRRLREISHGEWEGQYFEEIKARYNPAGWPAGSPEKLRAPGGESVEEVADRALAATIDICKKHPTGKVLLVSHGLTVATIWCQAHQISLDEVYRYIPENATPLPLVWKL